MARASGSSSPSAPSLGGRMMPSTGIIGSGFWSIKGISRRVVCSSTIEGSEKISPSQSGLPRYLNASIKDNEVDHALGFNGSVLDFPPKRHAIISCLQMNGKEVFRFAVRCVPQSIECALEKAGLTGSSIDWPLIHQANQRIIDAVATCLEVPPERIISNVANYGFGAGLTWGSAIIRWG
uniref:Beta-ketoacyl-[acyl-carrier-protein] synthase III C-terminal domain-containing protein n=1 Tax=Populus trichocarpa TaxID=3694 RepID=A0A3N7ENS4_POPTR